VRLEPHQLVGELHHGFDIAMLGVGFGRMYNSARAVGFSKWALQGRWTWLAVLGLFMVVGYVAERLARSESSRNLQYAGLGLAVTAEAFLLQPMLWILMFRFGNPEQMFVNSGSGTEVIPALSAQASSILFQAVVITLAIFTGLTAVVFVTKKDFSFMRGVLAICTFAALGVILASLMFGFHLGAIFSGIMILIMAGYILYQTSLVMSYFPPSGYVAASLMLFSTIATLFWYVLRLLMEMNRR